MRRKTTTTTTQPAPPPLSAAALLASMAAAQPTTGPKSRTLAVSIPELDDDIEVWARAKAQLDQAEAAMRDAEARIIEAGSRARRDACRRAGKVEASIRINGRVTLIQKCQYSPIPLDSGERLAAAFGADRDRYFVLATEAKLTDQAVADEALLSDILRAIGPDRFAAAFTVRQTYRPTEAFHADYTLRPEVEHRAAAMVADQTIKAHKPTLRV